jgi:hypothetical protein
MAIAATSGNSDGASPVAFATGSDFDGLDVIDPSGFGGTGTASGTVFREPADTGSGTGTGRPRGRPRKDGSNAGSASPRSEAGKTSASPLKAETLVPGIMIGHMFLGRVAPEFNIAEDEAKALAEAICNYLRHTKMKIDPKTRDFWALIMCVGMIEGPRVISMVGRVNAEKSAAKAAARSQSQGTVNVVPMTHGGMAGAPIDNWTMPTSR